VVLSKSAAAITDLRHALASRYPSGLNATLVTLSVWPVSGAEMGAPVSASRCASVVSTGCLVKLQVNH